MILSVSSIRTGTAPTRLPTTEEDVPSSESAKPVGTVVPVVTSSAPSADVSVFSDETSSGTAVSEPVSGTTVSEPVSGTAVFSSVSAAVALLSVFSAASLFSAEVTICVSDTLSVTALTLSSAASVRTLNGSVHTVITAASTDERILTFAVFLIFI